jgi:SAM-dependent methyltransferase
VIAERQGDTLLKPEAYDELHALEENHWWYRGMRRIVFTLLDQCYARDGSLDILDAGCGAGGNLVHLEPFGRVTGFDYSPLAVGYAATRRPDRLARASVTDLPYADASFDLVTSFDVIVCAEVHSDDDALSEFARVLRPGGRLLLRVAALLALRGPHDTVVHGVRRYTAPQLRVKLVEAGLEPERLTYANSLLMPAVFAQRQLQNVAVRLGREPTSDVSEVGEPLNSILTGVLDLEARWLARGSFPLGVSLIAVARKDQPQE